MIKKIIIPFLIMSFACFANAWDKIGANTYAVYGQKITESALMLPPVAEIVYNPKFDSFGISFIDTDGTRTTIPYGIFRIRTCAMDSVGAVAGPVLRDPASEDEMDLIFVDCQRPMFFRIWDTSNNYTLYKFEGVGQLQVE